MTDKEFKQCLIIITVAALLSTAMVVAEYILLQ